MFYKIDEFETTIGNFFNAPYAVAVDSCTHAIELCLRLKKITELKMPTHTYLSVPMTAIKLNLEWGWNQDKWKEYYFLEGTNIIDAAVFWKENGYIPGSLMCISFQFRKHLSLGRGGMILLDNQHEKDILVKMSYDGRSRDFAWGDQKIDILGYHYYMTPETAHLGLDKFQDAKARKSRTWSYLDYPDLSEMPIFKKEKNVK
jgi:dTDP-4-amino-4,6-dideoxygalactose transaminase